MRHGAGGPVELANSWVDFSSQSGPASTYAVHMHPLTLMWFYMARVEAMQDMELGITVCKSEEL